MIRLLGCILLAATACSAAESPTISTVPLTDRIAQYTIAVSLDPVTHMLQGTQRLRWRNTSPDVLNELQFHLYLNAFKNSRSTFMREAPTRHRKVSKTQDGWGWIDVTSIRTSSGVELAGTMEFISPDDGNQDDRTVARLRLPTPLPPGQTIELAMTFQARLPRVTARTGYKGDFYFIGQWFPKIGVYEAAGVRFATSGAWNCHQFHANSEFYADFGTYDVTLTVPKGYIVGATGIRTGAEIHSDSTVTMRYVAEDVHDFAWTASPRYMVIHDAWRHVNITVLIQPQRIDLAGRYVDAAKRTFEFLDRHVGPYPYRSLTIVDPASGAMDAGGMEYPTLITGGSFVGLGSWLRFQESVTVHELGHNYWQGMVASNEFEEAWLDEGVNQYYEVRIMSDVYGEQNSMVDLGGLQVGSASLARSGYVAMPNPGIAPIAQPAWAYTHGGYGAITYEKTATWLMTLERLIGRNSMDSIMHVYFLRWRFRHPCERDFRAVFNEMVPRLCGTRFGNSMDWFFDQMLHGTGTCDYAVTSLRSEKPAVPTGLMDSAGTKTSIQPPGGTNSPDMLETTVIINRLDEVMLPVDILVRFEDGSVERTIWDGKARTHEVKFTKDSPAIEAIVDPEHKLVVDRNFLNNSRSTDPPQGAIVKLTAKFLFWMQNIMQLIGIFG